MAKARVLRVEDDLSLRETLAAALELDGWEVEALANGRDALQALSVRRPDVIVLDLMMPVMDGWEFRRLQREHHGEIPVVVVSAAGEVHLAELRPDAYLAKPFELDAFLAVVRGVVRTNRDECA